MVNHLGVWSSHLTRFLPYDSERAMARPLRIELKGALYHISTRGNEDNPVYRDEADYLKFLEILSEIPNRYGALPHLYVLMENHYHILMETPEGNIKGAVHYLNATYAGYFNKRYRRSGHLFQGRYKGTIIEKEIFLLPVSRYLHLNPVRSGLVVRPEEYHWSSYPEYIGRRKKQDWMTYESVLEQYFQPEPMAQNLYKLYVEEGVSSREDPFLQQVGGILGRDQFIKEVRRKAKVKKHREIPDSRAITRGLKFEDVLNAVAKRFGIDKSMIKEVGQKGNQARKVSFYILRQFTDISNEKIGKYFGIGYTAVSQARSRIKKEMQSNRRLRKIIQDLERELVGKK